MVLNRGVEIKKLTTMVKQLDSRGEAGQVGCIDDRRQGIVRVIWAANGRHAWHGSAATSAATLMRLTMVNGSLVNGKATTMEGDATGTAGMVRQPMELRRLGWRIPGLQGGRHGMALDHRVDGMGSISNGFPRILTRSIVIWAPLSETGFGRRWWFLQLMMVDGIGQPSKKTPGKEFNVDVHRAGKVMVRVVSIGRQRAVEADSAGGCDINAT